VVNEANPRIWLAAVAGAACTLACAVAVTATAGSGRREALPDLDQLAPSKVTVVTKRTGKGRRHRLVFASAVANVGRGPLVIDGRRAAGESRMRVSQRVALTDGTSRRYQGAGSMQFFRSRDHDHWHLLGFDRYELRTLRGSRVVRDHKAGCCLTDGFRMSRAREPSENIRNTGFDDTDCGARDPRRRSLSEGISVGWVDDYDPYLEGQWLDVTRVRAGRYYLVHRVNVDRRLREERGSNNSASVQIRLTRRGGRPRARVLKRCSQSSRCPR
jgi:hypothetical protein